MRRIFRQLSRTGDPKTHQQLDKIPPEINLSSFKPEPRRVRKGMVVAVEGFAESDHRCCWNIVALHSDTIDCPSLMPHDVQNGR